MQNHQMVLDDGYIVGYISDEEVMFYVYSRSLLGDTIIHL